MEEMVTCMLASGTGAHGGLAMVQELLRAVEVQEMPTWDVQMGLWRLGYS